MEVPGRYRLVMRELRATGVNSKWHTVRAFTLGRVAAKMAVRRANGPARRRNFNKCYRGLNHAGCQSQRKVESRGAIRKSFRGRVSRKSLSWGGMPVTIATSPSASLGLSRQL